jgi:hypothetical protein
MVSQSDPVGSVTDDRFKIVETAWHSVERNLRLKYNTMCTHITFASLIFLGLAMLVLIVASLVLALWTKLEKKRPNAVEILIILLPKLAELLMCLLTGFFIQKLGKLK